MEIVVYLLAVLLTALAVLIFLLVRKIKNERSHNNKLAAIIKASEIYALTWTTDFSHIEANKPLCEFLDSIEKKADESFLKNIFLDNDDRGATGSVLLMKAMKEEGCHKAYSLPDGTVKHILWKSKMTDTGENLTTVVTTGTDITDEFKIKEELDAARRQSVIANDSLNIAAESAEIGILTITHASSGSELEISPSGLKMLGIEDSDISFNEFLKRISDSERVSLENAVHNLFAGKSTSETVEANVAISNEVVHRFTFRMKSTKSISDNINRVTAAFVDITSEHENIKSIDRPSNDDPFTGFLNRNGFFSDGAAYMEKAAAENKRMVMLSIRIDRYEKISTLFGLETSDQVILTYAQGIESCGSKSALFGRINPDNFAVIMPCENEEQCEAYIKNLHIFIENACNDKNLPSILIEQSRFSAGACFSDLSDEPDDITSLYNKANIMLFTDYAEGDGVCRYFDKKVEEKIYNRETIEEELRSAIKNGEFELYYQPKMAFDNSEMLGAEALMRWNHPKNGVVPPISFIPIAEEAGLITQIDEWGLIEACRQSKLWQDKGYKPICVSVNMSQAQFYQTDIVSTIKSALARTGLDAKYLEVELTETMAMQDIDRTISILKEIQTLGVSISMDDFGTGYSSLSALKLLPINILKIDRSLIIDIDSSATSKSIVKAIVDLGKALDLQVLAEGVETEEQSEILSQLGCTIAQGFLYGKPLTAADIERIFLKRNSALD